MERAQPSPRVPYRATSTPPRTPLHLPAVPGYRGNLRSPTNNNDYPESPTRGLGSGLGDLHDRGSREFHIKPLKFNLNQPPPPPSLLPPSKKRYLPRYLRSPKKALVYLILLGIIGFTLKSITQYSKNRKLISSFKVGKLSWNRVDIEEVGYEEEFFNNENNDDGLCRFVSPVEAYQKDLIRLRSLFPQSNLRFSESLKQDRADEDDTHHQHENGNGNIQNHHYTFSPTGHLLLLNNNHNETNENKDQNQNKIHPIPLLLNLGEKRWEELLSRQSRTLTEANKEYIKRYGRKPPKGFENWWKFFAIEKNLVLPDEYDRINLDLAPFFALPKNEMKRRMQLVENMEKTFTLIIENGEIEIQIKDPGGLKWGGTLPRAKETVNLLKGFSKFLPNMKATFSIFDQPQIYLSWARRSSLIDLGLRGELTKHLKETDDSQVKLSRSCAPGTNFRKNKDFNEGKSFIYDSLEAGDPCQNPYLIPLHGLTLEPHGHDSLPKPHTQLLPLFSLAKTSVNSDILITPTDQFHDDLGKDPVWEDKDISKLVWRGSPTGISMMNSTLPWRQSHRIRLHHFSANTSNDPMEFMIPDIGQSINPSYYDNENDDEEEAEEEEEGEGGKGDSQLGDELKRDIQFHASASTTNKEKTNMNDPLTYLNEDSYSTKQLMDFYYDMKLSGQPIQCSEEDGTCEDMRQEIEWAGRQSADELNRHKFLLDIDGNGWSGRFRRLMSTNSMVIKMTMFTEWFQPHLIPWFMYVPAKLDFSDLTDIMAFFRGTPNHPELGFDETAAALARNGQCFVQRMFRMEDLQAYMMRLFLEYARIAADEGVDMDFSIDDFEDIDEESSEIDEQSWINSNPNEESNNDAMEQDLSDTANTDINEEQQRRHQENIYENQFIDSEHLNDDDQNIQVDELPLDEQPASHINGHDHAHGYGDQDYPNDF
ncbi:uncharacterized protein L201_003424 [Kwoniella dendrophila CBS 6074]|uniref:Glycosyl transferase CAP10 domain-containing protein n=1 Tax=Kwoniella dendrophila CBS 6074 TaxID=1295534 RepID=A0AAX4JVH1_9TREE